MPHHIKWQLEILNKFVNKPSISIILLFHYIWSLQKSAKKFSILLSITKSDIWHRMCKAFSGVSHALLRQKFRKVGDYKTPNEWWYV